MEEAIRSSQLEGARTSRVAAKEMIRSGRAPKDRSERMIFNNYRAMQFIRDDKSTSLTPDLVCELQRIVADGTLDNPAAAGRLQGPDEDRIAVWEGTRLVHRPPPAEQLPQRMEKMCRFANKELEGEGSFIQCSARFCCTSGSPMTIHLKTVTVAPREHCFIGRCDERTIG